MLSQNETRVLSLIKDDPFISQKEIAEKLTISRSTVATLISSLTQKKQLLGRAYVVNQQPEVVCIGGMNIDRKYTIQGKMVPQTSNPVVSDMTVGGVARNVAENMGRLGQKVTLLSVAGHDQDFEWIKQQSESHIDMNHVTQLTEHATGTYSAIIDHDGEMQLALADMSIYNEMDSDWIKDYETMLSHAKLIIIDLNIPYDTVEFVISLARQKEIPLFIVPVSSPKMNHLPKNLDGVTAVITNEDESEAYFDVKVNDENDVDKIINNWLSTGLEQVILTRGSRPTYYGNVEGDRQMFSPPQTDNVLDVTGAGDSYVAGFIAGYLEELSFDKSIGLAMTNAYHTIQSRDTVRINLSYDQLVDEYKELKESGM